MKRFGLMLILILTASCEKIPEGPSSEEQAKPSLVFEGFTAQGTRAGVKEWEAQAKTAQVYQAKHLAKAQQVIIRYFQKGKEISLAQSDDAEINLETHDILAYGHLVLRGANGVVLYTERLKWNNQKERISSDAWVKVIKGDNVLTGRGLSADRQ